MNIVDSVICGIFEFEIFLLYLLSEFEIQK